MHKTTFLSMHMNVKSQTEKYKHNGQWKRVYLVSRILPVYPLRSGIKIDQFIFNLTMTVILHHWNGRFYVILLTVSHDEFRWLILVLPYFILIKRLLSEFIQIARLIPWKLNQTIKEKHINFGNLLYRKDNTQLPVQRHKPQLSASIGDIFHGFFYHQHAQSYHIADRGSYHLSHSKRKLHACCKRSIKLKHLSTIKSAYPCKSKTIKR